MHATQAEEINRDKARGRGLRIFREIRRRVGKQPEIRSGGGRGKSAVRQSSGTAHGSLTLTRTKLHSLGGRKSGYYRAMR